MKYESPISYGSRVMIKIKVFKMSKVMVKVNNFGTDEKVLSQGIHMCNMKALSLTVQKL